ncbi:MAG: AAA family ATPase [bacterium]|nr:AAA family ATPase [bacterium]
MLLALTVKNFKSIREARIRFGPFTCFVGHNGVGKSNLFDAIHFLSLLSNNDVSMATRRVRRTAPDSSSPLDLIYGRNPDLTVGLSADMIVERRIVDDFGSEAISSTSLLTYSLELQYDEKSDRLLVASEELKPVRLGDYKRFVGFDSSTAFRKSVASASRRRGLFISTTGEKIQLHGDGGSRGQPSPVGKSPLTVIGGTNTSHYPTVLAAKREMASWRLLHLEPSAMRSPDTKGIPDPHVAASGSHIPATLKEVIEHDHHAKNELLFRLRQLTSDVEDLSVSLDEARNQIVLQARLVGVDNWLMARSLSDGTLRYIALALMLVDAQDRALLCIEEPENGIHPSCIPNLVNLLRDYAVDTDERVASDNPLRQVIINSHSPEVARQIYPDEILLVNIAKNRTSQFSVFRPVERTWRDVPSENGVSSPIATNEQALIDFIGGSSISNKLDQLRFEFGTAQ